MKMRKKWRRLGVDDQIRDMARNSSGKRDAGGLNSIVKRWKR